MMTSVILYIIIGSMSPAVRESTGREFQILRHDTNQVEMCISNYGRFGLDETGYNTGCWWPTGSGHNYIYGAGICFGTIDSLTGDTLVTLGFDAYDGSWECAPGLHGMPVSHPCAIIYMSPLNWPPPGDTFPMAPQEAVSNQDLWCCFNDCDSVYHIQGGRPIGIEFYQTVYEWDIPFLRDMIFFVNEINNVSGHTLFHCYIGVYVNFEIGYLHDADEMFSGILERQYVIGDDTMVVDNVAYQWDLDEEPGMPPWEAGVVGLDLLQTPFDLVVGMDKDGDGILDQYERDSAYYVTVLPSSMWDADNDGVPDWRDPSQWPQLGMTALKDISFTIHPETDPEQYAVLAGYNIMTGAYEPLDTIPGDPDDQIFVVSTGPFNLPPDSSATLIFAVMFAEWMNLYSWPYGSDTAVALIDQYAQDYYNMYWYLYTGIEENRGLGISNCGLKISPNPISNTGSISFSLPMAASVSLNLYNTLGQLVETVYHGFKPAGVYEVNFNTQKLPQGMYFLVLETDSFNACRSIVIAK